MAWLSNGEKKFDDMFIRFDTSHERDRQTHTQTDTAWRHRPRLCVASRGKKRIFVYAFHVTDGETNRQTDKQMDSVIAYSPHICERKLNNLKLYVSKLENTAFGRCRPTGKVRR